MIIYNLRNNGPYEYDKFMLNIGQLHNRVYDEKKTFAADSLNLVIAELDDTINDLVSENSWVYKLMLIDRKRSTL